MEFCDNRGSYMKLTAEGYRCPRCGKLTRSKSEVREKRVKKSESGGIYVIDKPLSDYARISQVCPKCGNKEAFYWVSSISGEHAGIRRERTVEHFKCTKCSYSWSKSS